jgi:hypothetical protein
LSNGRVYKSFSVIKSAITSERRKKSFAAQQIAAHTALSDEAERSLERMSLVQKATKATMWQR